MGAEIREARFEDLDAIVQMLADDRLGRMREDPSRPVSSVYREAFAAIATDPNQALIVADQGGRVVGCLQLSFIPGLSRRGMWRGQIESVRIAGAVRGQGIGKAMISWAIDACRAHGCGLVQLTTDKSRDDARSFYEGLGFVASHEGMKLSLTEP